MVNILSEQQKQKRASKIAKVALNLFQEKGFNQISMNEIAKGVGMSKGSLFNYYQTKENLFMTLLLTGYQQYFKSLISELKQKPLETKQDLVDFLIQQITVLVQDHSTLIRLNSLRGPILETKASLTETIKSRQKLYDVSSQLSALIHDQLPELSTDKINHIFLIQSAVISGLMNLSGLNQFNHQQTYQNLTDFQINVTAEATTVFKGYLNEILGENKNDTSKTNS